MKLEGPGKIVRVYVGEFDHWQGKELYQAIVEHARLAGLAGTTVTRGIEGFGANSRLHTEASLRLSADLPIKIEIIDSAEHIDWFLPILELMVSGGLITVDDCEIVKYVHAPHVSAEP